MSRLLRAIALTLLTAALCGAPAGAARATDPEEGAVPDVHSSTDGRPVSFARATAKKAADRSEAACMSSGKRCRMLERSSSR